MTAAATPMTAAPAGAPATPAAPEEAPRSPEAQAADPPVRRGDVILDRALDHGALPAALAAHLDWPEALVVQAIARGGLWIDQRRFDSAHPPAAVAAGASLRLYAFEHAPRLPPHPVAVLHDAGPWFAVHKPPFWSIQATRAAAHLDLEWAVRQGAGGPEARAVHRLDRETSGVVLFARDGRTAGQLHAQFRTHQIAKTYHAWVAGTVAPPSFAVQGALVRVPHPRHSRFALQPAGASSGETLSDAPRGTLSDTAVEVLDAGPRAELHSHTDFTVLGPAPAHGTWVEARPRTGRTHQIRVHLAHHGHPIVGDGLYGAGWQPGGPSHLQLFAVRLAFRWEGATVVVEAPSPFGAAPRGA